MIDWATEVIDSIGLVGVAMLVALESVVPPIPSELVLLLAGFNVDQGNFTFVGAPDNEILFCGVAVGYADTAAPVNTLRSERMPLSEWVTFL